MAAREGWHPDWAVPPGEILDEVLKDRGISQSELARRMHRPIKTVNEIVNGKAALTADTAIQLELALGISARMWNGLESTYREHLARHRLEAALTERAGWADLFPLRALVRHKLIPSGLAGPDRVAAVLRFFGVSSPEAWEGQWDAPRASFRASAAFRSSPHAVSAWLRWGEILAGNIDTKPFDAGRFRAALREARSLTRRDPALVMNRLTDLCASAGVALVLTPELGSTRLSGAARWLSPTTAILQLSLRHKSDDHFWFSFFHEAAHLLERRRVAVVDAWETVLGEEQDRDDREEAADRWARNFLIGASAYRSFVATGDFSAKEVRAFADSQDVSPGIVVGRLQRDGFIKPSELNRLKKPVGWS